MLRTSHTYTHTYTYERTYTHTHTIHTHIHITNIAPSQPPTGFQVSSISPTDATLTWNPPALLASNGILTYYVVTYKCSPRGVWQQCTTKQIVVPVKNRKTVAHTIKGLAPFTLYSFQVAAETTAGRGPFSTPASNTTKQDGESVVQACSVSPPHELLLSYCIKTPWTV